jgi:hypothetical protein
MKGLFLLSTKFLGSAGLIFALPAAAWADVLVLNPTPSFNEIVWEENSMVIIMGAASSGALLLGSAAILILRLCYRFRGKKDPFPYRTYVWILFSILWGIGLGVFWGLFP